ncbi:hypothetical protein MLD38_020467 [Melastoma candidum]|uniref:Uncharacterized protein n=1 Tax=Melastoma candidum TaxID=119954 RepID=A0ACB9QDA3_9MYRT|nr:hypothetical protein MLD38_020467 [Melastoma candidum]
MVPPINTPVSPPPLQPQVAVSPLYCSPNAADLAIVSKSSFTSKTTFVVTDPSDNILFEVKGPGWTWHYHVSLLDAAGNPILNLEPKRCLSSRWNAYRGESTDQKDLLFTVKLKSAFKASKLDVFLANNVGEDRPDFRVEMNGWRTSCVIYAGDSNSVVAQMGEKQAFFGQFKYMVTVHPNVDAAFITAIIVILDEIYGGSSNS